MPNIVVNNADIEQTIILSKKTLDELVAVVGCPSDWFNFITANTNIIIDHKRNDDFVFVKVEWFKRSKDVEAQVVKILTKALKELGYLDITIYFVNLDNDYYYENEQSV
jgi:hypothetical protein